MLADQGRAPDATRDEPRTGSRWYRQLYIQVLLAVVGGATLGWLQPEWGVALKPLGDAFIKLIKLLVVPLVFLTVSTGIAGMADLRGVGRVGLKALIYFELVTTLALGLGYAVGKLAGPGRGMAIDPAGLDAAGVTTYAGQAPSGGVAAFLLNLIPSSVGEAFVRGEVLHVLLLALLLGSALAALGPRAASLRQMLEEGTQAVFHVVGWIMKLAPLGAFGAMAFTLGKFGPAALWSLGKLMACVYLSCLAFVFGVLGAIAWWNRVSLWRLLVYLREELLVVLGTSSSESVLPRLMAKLERLGCARPVVGLVLPTGYSFNLDGTAIYLTLATLFMAQALQVDLSWQQELTLFAVLMVTSKGAAAVSGGGFVTLAATLATVPALPVAGLALLLGVDRFMSEARALTNMVGNALATIVVARWEGRFDAAQAQRVLEEG
ncbi:MAG: C4-dicarboxylate transporter DctA [Candidatus Sericytochromatia bacterium]|nr:C4-dicarboxylate transporter DctA [Candidatus Sericytochromatia bacterium]